MMVSSHAHFSDSRRRRDRHGRGQGQLIPPYLPGWKTRTEIFDHTVQSIVIRMSHRFPEIRSIEFAVEDIPPSSPAPWETHDVCLARVFPRDSARGLPDRIVVYRRAVRLRCRPRDLPQFLQLLLAERISHVLSVAPEELLF